MLAKMLGGALLCLLYFHAVFGGEDFSLTTDSRVLGTNGSVCPEGPVTFTCIATNLSIVYWYINDDEVSSINTTDPIPQTFKVEPRGSIPPSSIVAAYSLQDVDDDSIMGITTTLAFYISEKTLRSVACGSRKNRDEYLIQCTVLPKVINFPTDQECVLNDTARFECTADPSDGPNVTRIWLVNGSAISIFPVAGFEVVEGGRVLEVAGCDPDWNETLVSCSLVVSPSQIFPQKRPSRLIVLQPASSLGLWYNILTFVSTNPTPWFIASVVVAGLCMLFACWNFVSSSCCCYFCKKSKKMNIRMINSSNTEGSGYHAYRDKGDSAPSHRGRNRTDTDLRLEERVKQEQRERDEGLKEVRELFPDIAPLPDLGSRLQKHWFKTKDTIVTRAPLARNCKLTLDNQTVIKLNRLLKELGALDEAALLQCNLEVSPNETDGSMYIIITQPLQKASLRDIIYKNEGALKDWSEKYECGAPLTYDQVRKYGRKILKGMLVLYNHGFPHLGHVHSGNIFIDGDICQLGGYENTILGYKTRLYRKISAENCVDDIDIILFGHVMYEMSAGKEMEGVVPTEEEYEWVQEPKCRTVVRYIFEKKNGKFKHSIEKISSHDFFKKSSLFSLDAEDILDAIGGTRMTSDSSAVAAAGVGVRSMAESALSWFKGTKRASDKTPLVELA